MGSYVKSKGEEGEKSDPESVVEIGKDEFKQPSTKQQNITGKTSSSDSSSRYWMEDLYKYYPRSYGASSGLFNFAWAQAVQNKSLNEAFVELNPDGKDNKSAVAATVNSDDTTNTTTTSTTTAGGGVDKEQSVSNEVVTDVESEKEEGELEEGEIDLDSDDPNNDDQHSGNGFDEMDDGELERQVSSIRKVLDNVTVSDANKSFDIVCARLKSSLETLRQLVLHTWFPSKDALIQQSFNAILCVNSVFFSMSPTVKDQNRDKMSKLITYVMTLSSTLFTPEQRKQVEAMNASVNPPAPSRPKSGDKQEELLVMDKAILTYSNTLAVNAGDSSPDYSKIFALDPSVYSLDRKNISTLSDGVKPSNLKTKANYGPLLEIHKVHDEDSLPSPTSKSASSVPAFDAAVSRVMHTIQNPGVLVHPYETDALKAVSTYQQKFGRSTFLTQDRLPSPTPSEEGNGGGKDDVNDEVSSYTSAYNSTRNTNPSVLPQPIVSSILALSSTSAVQGSVTGSSSALVSNKNSTASRTSTKSRDPRLRHMIATSASLDVSFCPSPPQVIASTPNLEMLGEMINPKKMKPSESSVLDGPAVKRQRSGLDTKDVPMNMNEAQSVSGSSGLENSGNIGSQSASASKGLLRSASDPRKLGNSSVSMKSAAHPMMNINSTSSLQSLLKDIAGNPAVWMNMFKEPSRNVSQPANSNSILGALPLPNIAPAVSSGQGQITAGLLQVPQDESAKLRMKPRDPRRVLHNNALQKPSSSGSEQPKVNGLGASTQVSQDNLNVQRHVNGANTSLSSQDTTLPDNGKQFTKNLKNIADIVSAPQASSVQPVLHISSVQPVQVNLDRVSVNSVGPVNSSDQHNGFALRPENVVAGRPQLQSAWGDVEHLFEGYDEKQKAAIQQERARRIGEQKKMFAARKLCLVLDLDHTLLNSAKFTEVDPMHDDILRKKEEQDREKPHRHLFRFPHMGMWTKLRPGIWNFLEKASKLYELHLYTMGNKLYATEMAKVLDPKGNLFAGRVISRGDDGDLIDGDERVPKSKDLEGVLGMESAVVIIDDSVRVWPHNKLNLIVVERYTYFPCSRRQFGLPGPSLLEIDHDERPEDGTLASSLAVIEKIHENFFSHKSLDDLDVRSILGAEQRKILAGCRIVFSRVFPVGEVNPHLHPLWQTAEQFGAVCTNQIDEQVTHVVANSLGTDKVNWALSTGRFVVHPGWVEASALLYRRANEQDFAIKS